MELKIGAKPKRRPYRIAVYGPPGVGKTCAVTHVPNGLYLNLNDGLTGVDSYAKDIAVLPEDGAIPDLQTFMKALEIAKASDYQTIVIDSLTEIDDWLAAIVTEKWNKDNRNKITHPDEADYGKGGIMMEAQWSRFMANVIIPINKSGKNVVLVAHSKTINIKEPLLSESYVKHSLKINNKAIDSVAAHLDAVLFFKQEVFTKTNANKQTVGVDGERFIYTSDTSGWLGKSRFDLPEKMPLDAGKLFQVLEG